MKQGDTRFKTSIMNRYHALQTEKIDVFNCSAEKSKEYYFFDRVTSRLLIIMPIAAFKPVVSLSVTEIRKEIANSRVDFVLSRTFWEAFSPGIDIHWSRPLRFQKSNKTKIPTSKGVYVFSIRCSNKNLPSHRMIFYVGQAGGNPSSNNTLRKRFSSYFNEKRERLLRFFNDYPCHIDFQFCELDMDADEILELESQLSDALQPPANQRDFSAKVRSARRMNLQ